MSTAAPEPARGAHLCCSCLLKVEVVDVVAVVVLVVCV
jgi:hypothetical protein